MIQDAVIVSAVRTPIGKFQGSFANISAPKLASIAIKEVINRINIDPSEIDEVILGNVLSAGIGQAPARQASLYAGIPETVNAFTVNKVCGSGLKAVTLAANAIRAGEANIIVAGGMENMSQAPYILEKARVGYRLGNSQLIDSMVKDGLWDVYNDFHMGMTAELVAEKYKITKEEQDDYAFNSYKKALEAQDKGYFKEEIVGVEIKKEKDSFTLVEDEEPKAANLAKLASLKPAFKKDGGTVTAGNASKIDDGAAALVIISESEANKRGLKPLAKITAYAEGALEPKWVMMAPVNSVQNLLKKTGLIKDEIDLFEFNEAFSVASIAVARELGIDKTKINVHGGAVALGHPIGASGARILVTLLYAMKQKNAKRGIAALCNGGGESVAVLVER